MSNKKHKVHILESSHSVGSSVACICSCIHSTNIPGVPTLCKSEALAGGDRCEQKTGGSHLPTAYSPAGCACVFVYLGAIRTRRKLSGKGV